MAIKLQNTSKTPFWNSWMALVSISAITGYGKVLTESLMTKEVRSRISELRINRFDSSYSAMRMARNYVHQLKFDGAFFQYYYPYGLKIVTVNIAHIYHKIGTLSNTQ